MKKNLVLLCLPVIFYSCIKVDSITVKDNSLQATVDVDAKANLTANTNATANINTNLQTSFIDNTSAFPVINMPNEIEIDKNSIIDINFDSRIDLKNLLSWYSTNDNIIKIISSGKVQAIGEGQANLIVLYKDRTAKIMKIKVKENQNIQSNPTIIPSPIYTTVSTPYPTPIYTYIPTPSPIQTIYITPTPYSVPTNNLYITPIPTPIYTPTPTPIITPSPIPTITPTPSPVPSQLPNIYPTYPKSYSFINYNNKLTGIKLNARNINVSPNGKKIVYSDKDAVIYIKDYETKEETKLINTGHYPIFINDEKIIYIDDNGIFKINIDGSQQEKVFELGFGSFFGFSPDGTKFMYRKDYETEIYLMDIATKQSIKINVVDNYNFFSSFEWSYDSTKIVGTKGIINKNRAEEAILLYDSKGNLLDSFYNTGLYPRLSPDNKKIAYYNQNGLFMIDVETKQITQLAKETSGLLGLKIDWSSDSKKIYYQSYASMGDNKYINLYDLETMSYKNILIGYLSDYNDILDRVITSP